MSIPSFPDIFCLQSTGSDGGKGAKDRDILSFATDTKEHERTFCVSGWSDWTMAVGQNLTVIPLRELLPLFGSPF